MNKDSDYTWLLSHLTVAQGLPEREQLSKQVATFLKARIAIGALPYTIGVFGGWGSGKTTFLALLAKQMENEPNCTIVYFNSWKYAGFMEIVPSLVYKVLQYGTPSTDPDRKAAAVRVLLSLGKEYSDKFGEWPEERVGVNPVKLFRDVSRLESAVTEATKTVRPELVDA